ncbi:hypothetical protein HYH03_007741 [Edaphochlamys debaryana]|uniref:Uncharacterized protein n=1 Tax=Edaphochlamys debaryana TaxID=47281 RepID=A0A835XZX0_9CHLO|nr:hypothetical protein HYH03_007741 [Edaphochlamys debaryana]|eukprot:KAG2494102.1 hypothetical protein HYH03_007741 [Edaphochlamys debaryana]
MAVTTLLHGNIAWRCSGASSRGSRRAGIVRGQPCAATMVAERHLGSTQDTLANNVVPANATTKFKPVVHTAEVHLRALPGPRSDDSSGLDFVDLCQYDEKQTQGYYEDACTYQLLVIPAHAVLRSGGSASSSRDVSASQDGPALSSGDPCCCGFNLKQLTGVRDNVIRKLSPVVAQGAAAEVEAERRRKARRLVALLSQQKNVSKWRASAAAAATPAANPTTAAAAELCSGSETQPEPGSSGAGSPASARLDAWLSSLDASALTQYDEELTGTEEPLLGQAMTAADDLLLEGEQQQQAGEEEGGARWRSGSRGGVAAAGRRMESADSTPAPWL